jgi:hypothetical protein
MGGVDRYAHEGNRIGIHRLNGRLILPAQTIPSIPFPNEVIMTATGLPGLSVAGTDLLLFVLAVAAFGIMWVIGWTTAGSARD